MDINVKVKLESPELMAAILALAEALPQIQINDVLSSKECQAVEWDHKTESKNEASIKETDELKKSEVKEITLEEVRAKLAALSQDGKQAQVKALITEFGAKKLSDIPSSKYQELLEKAEVL